MDPTIAYILLALVTLIEGGEFALLFAGFLLHLGAIELGMGIAVTLVMLVVGDLLWYGYGYALYQIPLLKRASGHMGKLDERIRTSPFAVAMLARFSYGTHRLTISRYRHNGITLPRMFGVSLGTILPWMLVVGTIVVALGQLLPGIAHVFRFGEALLAIGFVAFFAAEIGVTSRIRNATHLLNGLVVSSLIPATAWNKRFTIAYGFVLSVLFILLILTPLLIRAGISIFTEEGLEVAMLTVLSLVGLAVYRAYVARLQVVEDKYQDMVRHVGALNLQTVQVDAMFNELTRIPENKRDFRQLLDSLHTNILAAVDAPWVMTRVIDAQTGRTLTEQSTVRAKQSKDSIPEISNKVLLGRGGIAHCSTYRSDHRNTFVRAICVVSARSLNHHQEVVVRMAVNNIALLYLIYTSRMWNGEGE